MPATLWLALLTLLLTSCRLAKLSEGELRPAQREAGQNFFSLIEAYLPHCDAGIYVKGVDHWDSWFLRLFSPLKQKQEAFEMLSDREQGWLRLEHGSYFHWQGQRFYRNGDQEVDDWDRIYLASMALSMRLPFRIKQGHNKALLSPRKLGSRPQQRLFFSTEEDLLKSDHYIAHFDSNQISAFRFTMRDISPSFRAWILWKDMRRFGDLIFPSRIVFQDAYDSSKPVHQLTLSEVRCDADGTQAARIQSKLR